MANTVAYIVSRDFCPQWVMDSSLPANLSATKALKPLPLLIGTVFAFVIPKSTPQEKA